MKDAFLTPLVIMSFLQKSLHMDIIRKNHYENETLSNDIKLLLNKEKTGHTISERESEE
jgi:hypothetical protein